MIDSGYVGNPYTWHNKREKEAVISALAWPSSCQPLMVKHMFFFAKSFWQCMVKPHAPILLNAFVPSNNNHFRFNFEAVAS